MPKTFSSECWAPLPAFHRPGIGVVQPGCSQGSMKEKPHGRPGLSGPTNAPRRGAPALLFPFPSPRFLSAERVLKQQKKPLRRLCFSAALLMARRPPASTIRSRGGCKGHVRGAQLPRLQREMQNHGFWPRIAWSFPGYTALISQGPCTPLSIAAPLCSSLVPLFYCSMKKNNKKLHIYIYIYIFNYSLCIYRHMLDI